MFLVLLEGGFLLFAVWAVVYEAWTAKRWPRDSYHFLLAAVGLGVLLLATGAI